MKKRNVFTIAVVLAFISAGVCFSADEPQTKLTPQDIQFLKECNIDQADIDAIPNLPRDGRINIELILESPRRNCDRQIIKAFKATREFLKKFTPPPQTAPLPPAEYNRIYLTLEEQVYLSNTYKHIMDRTRTK